MKLLRTIRFDGSDEHVYATAALPEEWAVSGAFAFSGIAADQLTGKTRQAFANGFLGLDSFGRSTFACVAEAKEPVRALLREALAAHLVAEFGAPPMAAAEAAADEEIAFVAGLCAEAPINTVFTVRRTLSETGDIAEEFRTIKPPTGEPLHARIWTIVPDET